MAALSTTGVIDILLVGDSLAQHWPLEIWAPWRALSLGIGGDRTQHILWRLDHLQPSTCRPTHIVIVAGTNNLLAGDAADDIAAGIEAIAGKLVAIYPESRVFILLPPPLGVGLQAGAASRREMKRRLGSSLSHRIIDADVALIAEGGNPNPNYETDLVHLTPRGYEVLTGIVRAACR